MAKILDVYFHEKIIGELTQNDYGQMAFSYSSSWLEDPNAIAISCSLPLEKKSFTQKECRPFFSGILPESDQRILIAKILGISANNDFSMLKEIGGECAGAISFMPSGVTLPDSKNYHWLSDHELANMLRMLHKHPLLAGETDVRLSLAGVQDKITVYVENDKISVPLNGAPSTHIIKLDNGIFDEVIFNEAFCLEIARKIGLLTTHSELKKVEDINYLLIRRYDRPLTNNAINSNCIIRWHQEDFCQALGIVAENKYQNEGGPSLKQCFNLLRTVSRAPVVDINKLTDIVIFNFLIGNCDAHGKNFSLLYKNNSIELAPFYDLISTVFYKDLSTKIAMKLGGEYEANKITIRNFEILADDVGLAKPGIRERVYTLASSIIAVLQEMETHRSIERELSQLINMRCAHILQQK